MVEWRCLGKSKGNGIFMLTKNLISKRKNKYAIIKNMSMLGNILISLMGAK